MSSQKPKQRVVVISPTAGFGNRMRAMCAAAIIAKKAKAKLVHCWDGGPHVFDDSPARSGTNMVMPKTQHFHDRGFEFFFKRDYIPRFDNEEHEKPDLAYTEWLNPAYLWTSVCDYGRRKFQPSQSHHQEELIRAKHLPKCSFFD